MKLRHSIATSLSRGGFTLLELTISVTLLVTITIAAAKALDDSQGAWSTAITSDELDSVAQVALDRVARDLTLSMRGSLAPNTTLVGQSTTTLDYTTNTGWGGAAIIAGPLTRIALELDPAELDDGIDNDSDGLTDERVLVWRENPGAGNERRSGRASYVAELLEGELANGIDDNGNGLIDEAGFCIAIDGNILTLRLTLQRPAPDGALLTSTVETSVLVRN